MKKHLLNSAILILALTSALTTVSCKTQKTKYVKVGLLHSLTGTMSISEIGVRDAELLAIKELNEAGGVLGCQIKVVEEDGKSNPRMFAEKAKKLLEEDVLLRKSSFRRHFARENSCKFLQSACEKNLLSEDIWA